MSNDNRDGGGRFAASVDDTDILEAIDQAPGPVATAAELADILPIGRRAIRERLLDLEERDKVARKTVGARSVVWWLTRDDATSDEMPDFRSGFGALAGSDFAEQVQAVGDDLEQDFRESERELFANTDDADT